MKSKNERSKLISQTDEYKMFREAQRNIANEIGMAEAFAVALLRAKYLEKTNLLLKQHTKELEEHLCDERLKIFREEIRNLPNDALRTCDFIIKALSVTVKEKCSSKTKWDDNSLYINEIERKLEIQRAAI